MFIKVLIAATLVSVGGGLYIVNMTSPMTAGPVMILLLFGCFYIATAGMLSFLMSGIQGLVRYIMPAHKTMNRYSIKDFYYVSSMLALAPVMLVAMQSVGRLNWYEVLLVVCFEIIALFYISRRVNNTA